MSAVCNETNAGVQAAFDEELKTMTNQERCGANQGQKGSDPPLAKFFFPCPAPPAPLRFAEPECLSFTPAVLPRLTDSHPLSGDEFGGFDLDSGHENVPSDITVEWERVASLDTHETAATPEQSQRPIRGAIRPFVSAGIGAMVVGILLAAPSSIRSHHTSAKRFTDAASSVPQPEILEVANVAPALGPSLQGAKSRLSLYASDQSWVVACVDDKLLFAKLFTAGNMRTLEFDRRAIVRVGSAGSVHVAADGNPQKTMGGLGEVRIMEFTPGDSRFLTGGEVEDCTQGY